LENDGLRDKQFEVPWFKNIIEIIAKLYFSLETAVEKEPYNVREMQRNTQQPLQL
jgi:hypothetical protein